MRRLWRNKNNKENSKAQQYNDWNVRFWFIRHTDIKTLASFCSIHYNLPYGTNTR